MLIGTWNCVTDRVMKAIWAVFTIVYVALYAIFRQHRVRVKFDDPKQKLIVDPVNSVCNDEC